MNSLLGVELPTPVNFIIAFIVVLALIGAATWLIRRFGATRLEAAARGRQPRLAVIDQAAVDGRRKLVIIRRDNVEHLLMIGGPNDVVVESAIVRAAAPAAREAPPLRAVGAETLPRAMPLPDPTPWPLQPEPAPAPAPAPAVRPERERPRIVTEESAAQWPHVTEAPSPALPPRRPADALSGLAAELAKPSVETPRARPAPAAAARPAPTPPPAAAPQEPAAVAAADKNLADMAQRLELALRQQAQPQPVQAQPQEAPAAKPAAVKPPPAKPAAEAPRPELKPVPRPEPAATPEPAKPAAPQAKSQFESLEQEMASLLGRSGKT